MNSCKIVLLFAVAFLLLFFPLKSKSVNYRGVDSLKTVLSATADTKDQFEILLSLYYNYEDEFPDSASEYLMVADSIAHVLNVDTMLAHIDMINARINERMSNYDLAMELFDRAEAVYRKTNYLAALCDIISAKAMINEKRGFHDKAIKLYMEALKIEEKRGNKKALSHDLNNLGILHRKVGNNERALYYYQKSLEIKLEIGDKNGAATAYNNIGTIYCSEKNFDEGVKNLLLSLNLKKEMNDIQGVTNAYGNLGRMYTMQGKYKEARNYYLKALELSRETENQFSETLVYAVMADNEFLAGNFNDVVRFGEKSLALSKQMGILDLQIEVYNLLCGAYEEQGQPNKALQAFKELYALKDSLFNVDKMKQIEEIEAKYQSEKKQLEIDNLNKEKTLQDLEVKNKNSQIQKQRVILISFILGFIIILGFSIAVYRLFVQKKKANVILEYQNNEIKLQKEEIESQRDEIESQRDELLWHRDLILHQKEEIQDSIRYAKRIQSAILSSDNLPGIKDHFIYFRPKDVVSGDFYWSAQAGEISLIAVVDCTGHGVPGAFMSMLGISFLNEIVKRMQVVDPAQILTNLRSLVIESLQQKAMNNNVDAGSDANDFSVKDGMDISLICINHPQMELSFAGANNPIYIIPSEKNEIIEIKGDKMPIAIYDRMDDFEVKKHSLESGDRIYLFSDGYADQFGGPAGKKFKYKPFKQLLLETCESGMNEQKSALHDALENWMFDENSGNSRIYEQVDDITIVGLLC